MPSIPVSTAPVVRSYLFAKLGAELKPDASNVSASLLVCYDVPGPNQPDDIVAIGAINRTIATNSLVGSGGAGWLEETYTVTVSVDVFRSGDVDQDAYLRCTELTQAVVDVVRSDPSMGGAVLTARPVTDATEVEWDDAHMGRHATCDLAIQCYQRI